MQRALVSVPGGTAVPALVEALRRALDGTGPALALAPEAGAPDLPAAVPAPVALVLATSGSTGVPRWVLLDADAVVASARATHDRLGGPGRWALALPAHHVAGVQVVARSVLAGAEPVVLPRGHFDPGAAADALRAARRPGERLYCSLVPTQLHRIVEAAAATSVDQATLPTRLRPWAALDAVLVGGAATSPALVARARALGLRVVTTYGMTETSGGCVYDGAPLAGVRVRVGADGAVELAGPVLARGYLPDDPAAFVEADGARWFRTTDLGEVVDGVLHVLGRADDVIVTGGVKVAPTSVEAVLADLGLVDACVVGLPDAEWGQVVTLVLPAGAATPDLARVRDAVGRARGAAAAPRAVVVLDLDRLPQRGPGKVDRAAVARAALAQVTHGSAREKTANHETAPHETARHEGGVHGERR